MPQANTIDLEAFDSSKSNLDLISDKGRRDHYYLPPSSSRSGRERRRERTYSLPTRPQDVSFHGSHLGREGREGGEGDDDSDPVERMRRNLERTTFLLSNLKVSLSSKPEEIRILPPLSESDSSDSSTGSSGRRRLQTPGSMSRHHSEPQKHSSSYYDSHPPPPARTLRKSSHAGVKSRLIAPGMERSDSNATAFSIDVSTYSGESAPQPEDHGSEFHQLMNHGRLHNPSRGSWLRRQAVMSTLPPPTRISSRGQHHGTPARLEERKDDHPEPREKAKGKSFSRHPTPYPAPSKANDSIRVEEEPKIRSRPFPPSHLPYTQEHPPSKARGHGRSVSVSHAAGQTASGSKLPGMRRVRFDF